jgi:hypothetical protein
MAGRWVRHVTALVAVAAWSGALLLAGTPDALAAHSHSAATSSTPTATAAATTPGPLSGVNPLSPVPTTTSTSSTAVATGSTSTAGGSSLGAGSALAIAVGAIALIGGISYFIWRDSRRHAPVRTRSAEGAVGGDGRRTGSKPPSKPRKLSPAERRRRKRGRARR